MSPASSGALEIERYIGACLISSQQSRHKTKHHHFQQHQPPSQFQQHQLHHNQLVAGNLGNHGFVPDIYQQGYQGYHHQQHQQLPQQHIGAGAIHQPQQQVGGGDRWAGGLPLIVYSKHQQQHQQHRQFFVAGNLPRRMVDLPPSDKRLSQSAQQAQQHQSQECNNPLSRLAVHTQGAPLILSHNRYRIKNKGKFNPSCGIPTSSVNKQHPGNSLNSGSQVKSNKCREINVDTVSVASDESSGSANSENCLPRIIKPRKRRKKDRKPPPHLSTSSTSRSLNQDDSFSTDSGATTSPDIINTTTSISLHMPPSFPSYSSTRDRIASESVTSTGSNDISETPNLHHSFEDIEDHLDVTDINGNVESSCQCRYCDPSGQIWDIDRNCYSPFLTNPVENMFRFPTFSSSYKSSSSLLIDQCPPSYIDVLGDHHHHHQCLVNDISTFSLEDKNISLVNMDNASSRADVSLNYSNHQLHRSQPDLEVSTEIVTSLNGHRDLEIKFFTSPSSLKKECIDDVIGDSVESEIDNQAGYLMLDVKCRKMLDSEECD